MKQLINLIKIQYLEFFREPGVVFWSLLFPIIMAWGLGLAFSEKAKVEHTIAWVQSPASDALVNCLLHPKDVFKSDSNGSSKTASTQTLTIENAKTGNVSFHFVPVSNEEAILMIKRGQTGLILKSQGDSIRYCFDPKNAEGKLVYLQLLALSQIRETPKPIAEADTSSIAKRNSNSNTEEVSIKSLNQSLNQSSNQSSNPDSYILPLNQKGMRYIDFLVPGLLAMNIMFGSMWGISYSLVEKRSKKLLRRMVATPMNKGAFLFSFFFTRISLSIVELFFLLFFAWWYFGTTVQGSPLALAALVLAGNIAFFGIAVLFSSRAAKTQVANGIINAVTMPMMICSGIFFSYHNFPVWMVNIIRQLPLTQLADSIRSVFIEGAGLPQVQYSILLLTGMGVLCFLFGKRIYRWY